jgi:hypothetical protein
MKMFSQFVIQYIDTILCFNVQFKQRFLLAIHMWVEPLLSGVLWKSCELIV